MAVIWIHVELASYLSPERSTHQCRYRTGAVSVVADEQHSKSLNVSAVSMSQRTWEASRRGFSNFIGTRYIECGTFFLGNQLLDRGCSRCLEESFRAKHTVRRVWECFGRNEMRWTVRERDALKELLAAHADMERLTDEIMDARERRRDAARRLIEMGRGTSWIARHLDVSPQAVDAFLKYKQRKSQQ